jgi:non-ribosomal peptide synthetase component F
LGHDPVLRDIFVPISTDATINIPDQSIIINPEKLFSWINGCAISHIHATPQLMKIICAGAVDVGFLPNLLYAFSGGDALKINQVTQLKKLNDDLTETRQGEVGQIGIETCYLSEGYLHDQSMTNGRFVSTQHTANKVYLTGDYGVKRSDGALVLKGRMDDQIKIRGFRRELGEIVTALELDSLVQTAVVLTKKNENGENYLIAYLVQDNAAPPLDD